MRITIADTVSNELIQALQRLIPQLTEQGAPITTQAIQELVEDRNTNLLVATNQVGEIVGSLTLVVFTIPTGKKAFIEDVIVDGAARGMGLGEQLLTKAIEVAKDKGVKRIELSSRPLRVPANKLYQKMGFKVRETNFYRLEL